MLFLAKCRGYDPARLMELVITDEIRAERPQVEQTEPEEDQPRKPKKALTARQLRAAQKVVPQPVTNTSLANTRKGAPKTVPPRKQYTDPQFVQDALHALLQDDSALKAMFCEVSIKEAKRLIRTDERIEQLIIRLRPRLASPTRVYTCLDTAVRILIPQYKQAQLEDRVQKEVNATKRRKMRQEAAQLAAERRQKRRRLKEVVGPGYWRALNQI